MQNEIIKKQLEAFLKNAMCATYAAGGERVLSQRPQFNEYFFEDGDWCYRDSYAGYLQSWGQEVVWYKNKPFWTQIYGGGIENMQKATREFAAETFKFLKLALSSKETKFQPRGPNEIKQGDWIYRCKWCGNIAKFKGHEEILHKSVLVFTHDFVGGLITL